MELQIVLPVQYQLDIPKMAHDMPMAGHTGVERTLRGLEKVSYSQE